MRPERALRDIAVFGPDPRDVPPVVRRGTAAERPLDTGRTRPAEQVVDSA
jgi:hypothetical protein